MADIELTIKATFTDGDLSDFSACIQEAVDKLREQGEVTATAKVTKNTVLTW